MMRHTRPGIAVASAFRGLLAMLLLSGLDCMKAERLGTETNSAEGLVFSFLTITAGTASISNLRTGGLVETGFVVGTSSGGRGAEVSLDGGAFVRATGADIWSFALPTGAATWRPGTQHTIAVRVVGALTASTIMVRKGTNKDVNGDGYADLAVGAPGEGYAYLFHGGASGISAATTSAAGSRVGGGNPLAGYGSAVALGDIDGDGYADLVVGAPTDSFVQIFPGGPTGLSLAMGYSISGDSGSDFGASLALGDVNGDGYDDVAVGAIHQVTACSGGVLVFHGATFGVVADSAAGANTILAGVADCSLLTPFLTGSSVTLGDVNGDGRADLGVGAPGNHFSVVGAAYLFWADAEGISASSVDDANVTLTGGAGTYFGSAMALGDMNGDGCLDLAVGAPQASSGAGEARLYLNRGSAYSLSATADRSFTGSGTGSLGQALAFGDVNGDGYADLAIGAPGTNGSEGQLLLFPGGSSVLLTPSVTMSGEDAGSIFGSSIAFADLQGDGYADLTVGASQYGGSSGRAYVFPSAGSAGLMQTTASATISGASGSGFGQSLD